MFKLKCGFNFLSTKSKEGKIPSFILQLKPFYSPAFLRELSVDILCCPGHWDVPLDTDRLHLKKFPRQPPLPRLLLCMRGLHHWWAYQFFKRSVFVRSGQLHLPRPGGVGGLLLCRRDHPRHGPLPSALFVNPRPGPLQVNRLIE